MKQTLFALMMAMMPMMAFADAVEIDGIYYNLIKKAGVAEVTKHPQAYEGDIVIPDSVVYHIFILPVDRQNALLFEIEMKTVAEP